MRQIAFVLCGSLAIFLAFTSSFAQHTPGGKFDLAKPLTVKGTVTQIDWSNPYVHVLMKVPDAQRPVLWAVELDGAINLAGKGWSQESLPLGESITVQGFVAKDGSKQILANSVTTGAGKKVYSGVN